MLYIFYSQLWMVCKFVNSYIITYLVNPLLRDDYDDDNNDSSIQFK
jgi:hypothetical protein